MSDYKRGISSSQKKLVLWWILLCRWLWKIAGILGISVLLPLGVNVLSTWLTASKGIIPVDSPLGKMSAQLPITLLIGCCLLLLAFLFWAISRWSRPTEELYQPTVQDRERMLRRLRLRYEQMLAQSLQGAVQVELGLASRPAAVQNAASLSLRLPDQPEQLLAPHTSIQEVYELAQQELLILGEPGAGKSTFLLELACYLVEQVEQDAKQPLPILLPLSTWATRHLPLQEWLTEQFALLYDTPRKLSQQWIESKLILPLLDGLDEMEVSARATCITTINTYHREHLRPLVVCSRTNEYEAAATSERIAQHTAVIVQPLSSEQIDSHLANFGKPLAALRTALRKNHVLRELATTPLMLQVLMLTYHGTSVRELPHKETQLREQIWAEYVQRMISRRGDRKHYSLDDTHLWLGWLAREMRAHNQTIFLLEHLQPDCFPPKQKVFYQWSIGLVIGLVFGLIVGLIGGLVIGLVSGLVYGLFGGLVRWLFGGLVYGLVGGLLFGIVIGLVGGLARTIEPAETLTLSWKGLLYGLLYGLLIGLIGGLIGGLLVGLIYGIFGGLIGMLFGGLIFGFSSNKLTERLMLAPNEGIRRSIKNGLLVLVVGQIGGIVGGQISILVVGLLIGQIIGLLYGLGAAVQHYTLRFWLWRTHRFPWKVVPFLENATALVLLQHVGGGYSFTHRLLLDYFADLTTAMPSSSSVVHSAQLPLS